MSVLCTDDVIFFSKRRNVTGWLLRSRVTKTNEFGMLSFYTDFIADDISTKDLKRELAYPS